MRLELLLRLAWLVAALLSFVGRLGQDESSPSLAETHPDASQAVEPSLREELFAIEWFGDRTDLELGAPEPLPAADPSAADGPKFTAVARLRRLPIPGGQQLELDIQFFVAEGQFVTEGARVLHTERSTPHGTTLVWREILPGAGRTVSARPTHDGTALALREWAGRLALQTELPSSPGWTLPLHLLELARSGAALPASVQLFDPLARQLEVLDLSASEPSASVRRVDLNRDDGTFAARWLLVGGELVGFQWQGGSLLARRIALDEYDRLLVAPEPSDLPDH